MKKKYIITVLTCVFLIISGVLYSCSYRQQQNSLDTVTTLSEDSQEEGLDTEKTDTIHLQEVTANKDGIESEDVNNTTEASAIEDSGKLISDNKATDTEQLPRDIVMIYVHICGAVINQGVYEIEDGSRIIDVIKLAGGLSEEAAGDYVNQAQKITDGQRIYIPTKEETKELSAEEYEKGDTVSPVSESSPAITDDTTELININTADKDTLMELPGIGETKATNIIDYRTTNGNFQSNEELINIPKIKEDILKKISQYITIN
jgi:competence protein ComEA